MREKLHSNRSLPVMSTMDDITQFITFSNRPVPYTQASTCLLMHNFNHSHWIPAQFILYTFICLTASSKNLHECQRTFVNRTGSQFVESVNLGKCPELVIQLQVLLIARVSQEVKPVNEHIFSPMVPGYAVQQGSSICLILQVYHKHMICSNPVVDQLFLLLS